MSARIAIHFRPELNREPEVFTHRPRPGGSYTLHLTFDHGFAVVTDEWGKRTVFPENTIERIEDEPERY